MPSEVSSEVVNKGVPLLLSSNMLCLSNAYGIIPKAFHFKLSDIFRRFFYPCNRHILDIYIDADICQFITLSTNPVTFGKMSFVEQMWIKCS